MTRRLVIGLWILVMLSTGCSDDSASASSDTRRDRGDISSPPLSEAARNFQSAGADYDLDDYGLTVPPEIDANGLQTLGYVDWVDGGGSGDDMLVGTTLWNEQRAWLAPALFKSLPRTDAMLMGMDGKALHTWRLPGDLKLATLYPFLGRDGNLFVVAKNRMLFKLDWNSQVLWEAEVYPHHDLQVMPDGRIYALTEHLREIEYEGDVYWLRDNAITVLSTQGEVEKQVMFSPLLMPLTSEQRKQRARKGIKKHIGEELQVVPGSDIFHTNSLEVLEQDVPGLGEAGDVLISVRSMNRVFVLSLEEPRVVWSWGEGELEGQHHASVVGDGHVLMFDNGNRREWSRVIEMDPVSGEIVWEYPGPDDEPFYSKIRGSTQRLPNGNTVIVISHTGRAIEVTREGEIVWEFLCPDVNREKGHRAAFYRLPRLTDVQIADLPLDFETGR